MHNQRGDIDARHVLTEVSVPSADTFQRGYCRGPGCDIPTGLDGLLADELSHQHVGVIKILEEFGEERETVCLNGGFDSSKNVFVHTLWIVRCLEQVGRYPREDHCLAYVFRTVFPDISSDFATAHRET